MPSDKKIQKFEASSAKASRDRNLIATKEHAKKRKVKVHSEIKFPEVIQNLIAKGYEHGFVTFQEIMQAMPEPERNLGLLDLLYAEFLDQGIEGVFSL